MEHLGFSLVALTLTCALSLGPARSAEVQNQSEATSVGYVSVAEALAALRAKPGVKFRTQGGMTIAEDFDAPTPAVWIFVPKTHPAYPSAIKRVVSNAANGTVMDTRVRCEASKDVCDRYFGQKVEAREKREPITIPVDFYDYKNEKVPPDARPRELDYFLATVPGKFAGTSGGYFCERGSGAIRRFA